MAAVIPEPGSSVSTASALGGRGSSWPAEVRRYCGMQVIAIGSCVLAVLGWILLDSGAAMLAPPILTTMAVGFVSPVLHASFLKRRVATVTFVGHALMAGAMSLMLLAQLPRYDYFFGVPLGQLPWAPAAFACLLLGLPMTTWGLLCVLESVTGPWHGPAKRTLWASFAGMGASLLLQVLVSEIDVPGPGAHELTAELFVLLGLMTSGSGVLLVLMSTLVRLRRACEPTARAVWTDASGAPIEVVELRGGHSLACDAGRTTLGPSLEVERGLSRAGCRRHEQG